MRLRIYCLLAMLWPVVSCFAQPSKTNGPLREITGNLRNKDGEALANANIIIGKTGRGTVTDAKGNFRLRGVTDRDVIQISLIGYQQQRIMVNNRSSLLIILEPAVNELDKVVVQAYGVTSQRLSTGNISRVTAEEIGKHPVMNAMQVLQGLVPGAAITNASGSASSSMKVEIRGRNSIDPNILSEPLYIIDGVPLTVLNISKIQSYAGGSIIPEGAIQSGLPSDAGTGQSQFFGINPNDIESIEVLKDADATAIYGSRASNGVILITTKKGKAGKTHSEFSVFTGYSQVPRYYSLLNTQQYVAMRKEALANDGLPVNVQSAPDLVAWDTTRFTNWQKYLFGSLGRRTSVQGNISGGDARTSFRASGGYDYDKDIVTLRGGNTRGAFSLNLSHKSLNQRLTFSWSAMYSISKIDATNRPGSVLLPPNAPAVFDNSGNLNYKGWGILSDWFPFSSLFETYVSKSNFLNSNISLSYEISKGLIISAALGHNNGQSDQTKISPIASKDPSRNPTGVLQMGHSLFQNIMIEPKIEYNGYINKGKLMALAGGTAQANKTEGLLNVGMNYNSDLLLNSINNSPSKNTTANYGEYKYTGVFARLNYNWQDKYILNLNARRDGSSRFGPGRQFGNFGSVGGVWIFSQENWLKHQGLLSFGKLRGSYGITGSDQISDYEFLSRWSFGGVYNAGTYNSMVPLSPVSFSDSLLQWEVNRKLELAANLGFLKDRIIFEVSWYRNICGNQLVFFPTPALSGFTSVTSNSPAKVENTGWEFVLNAKIIDRNAFKWATRGTLAINRNKLLAYPNILQSPFAGKLVIGQPLYLLKLLHSTGVDSQTGLYTFEDINHDGQVTVNLINTSDDRIPISLTPQFEGGFTSSLSYKNWSLSVFFFFRKQLGTNILVTSGVPGKIMTNQSTDVLSRWQKPGDKADIGKFTTRSTQNNFYYYSYSDARVTDASFIRLQNLSLSYSLAPKVTKKAGLINLKLFIQGENLLILTRYKGIDPETQALGAMPRPRIVTGGITCNL